jgi:hypothetical protein
MLLVTVTVSAVEATTAEVVALVSNSAALLTAAWSVADDGPDVNNGSAAIAMQ